MCMEIKNITYEDAKSFINDKTLIIKHYYNYYSLINKGKKLSVVAAEIKNKTVKFHANYTPFEFRGNGYFTKLLKEVIDELRETGITYFYADCTDHSKNIYYNLGFKIKAFHIYKNFNITKMEKDYRE